MRGVITMAAVAAALLVTVGCGVQPHPGWDEPLEPQGPAMMSEAMVFLDQSFEELIVVRSEIRDEQSHLNVERVATGESPSRMQVSADGSELYVLNDKPRTLSIFEVGAESVEREDVVLESAYDVITVDPEGEFVLLSNSGQARDDVVVQNLNEVGIVDLRGGEPEARFMSLPSRAQNLEFMPPFELGGESQRLAVALADSEVTLVDLTATEAYDQWRRIPLTISQADSLRTPTQVVVDVNSGGDGPEKVSLFVLTQNDNDVTEIVVQQSIREDQHRKFDISVNQLAAGQSPGRISMLTLPEGRRLLALDRQQPRFTLVDVSSGESATFSLPLSRPATELITFTAEVAGDPGRTEKKVLVYAQDSTLVAVISPETIALGSETPSTGQTVHAIRMAAAPSTIRMDETGESNRAVALHAGGSDGFTVLNLQTNTEIPLRGNSLSEVVFDSTWAYGIFGNSPHMVRVDMASGHTRVFELPARARALYLSPDRDSVMVRHDGKAGRFTVLPVASPTPQDARLYENVFLTNVLDRPAIDND